MKHTLFLCTLLIFSLVIFNACKKDNAARNNNNNVINTLDSNYLLRTLRIDSTATGQDTLESFSYYYDNAQRVTTVTDSGYTTTSGTIFLRAVTYYYYNGTDTLPYKSVRAHLDGPNFHDTSNVFYYYDAAGKR